MDNILDGKDSMGEFTVKEKDPWQKNIKEWLFQVGYQNEKTVFIDLLIMLGIFTGTTLMLLWISTLSGKNLSTPSFLQRVPREVDHLFQEKKFYLSTPFKAKYRALANRLYGTFFLSL